MDAEMGARRTYEDCKQPEDKAYILVAWENDCCRRGVPKKMI